MPDAREPARAPDALAWDLRAAWAGGWQVVATTRRGARVRGLVEHVAPTGAFALLWNGAAEVHVPVGALRSVRRPALGERDGTGPVRRRRRAPIAMPARQLAFDFDGRPEGWTDPRVELAERRREAARLRAANRRRKNS